MENPCILKPEEENMKILILGGTGLISRGIVNAHLAKGDSVTVLNRGTRSAGRAEEVEQLTADRRDATAFMNALRGRKYDAVIDMICFNKSDAEQSLKVLGPLTEHLIICSSVAAYSRPYLTVPSREDDEELTRDPVFAYSYDKAEMERYLVPRAEKDGINLTLVRPSLTYGEGAVNVGTLRQNYNIVHRIKEGKPLLLFGDGHHSWSFSFAPDVGRWIAALAGNPAAYRNAYHVCSEERTIWRDLYSEIGDIVGKVPVFESVPASVLYYAYPELCAHLYFEKSYSGLFDNTKRISLGGDAASPSMGLRKGLELVIDSWERAGAVVDTEKDALEDRITAAARDFRTSL